MQTQNRPATRIEAFTDAAFAFALTMLVISFDQLPRSVDELVQAMKAIPSFLLSGSLLMTFWHTHSQWSQRYYLGDRKVVIMSCLLVFTVMVYVYPLRLMMSGFMHWITGGFLAASFSITKISDLLVLYTIYSVGFSTMCLIMALLFQHTLHNAELLSLNNSERFNAKANIYTYTILGCAGILCLILTWTLPKNLAALAAPLSYMPLGFVMPWFTYRFKQNTLSEESN